jgi:hypothetical protein
MLSGRTHAATAPFSLIPEIQKPPQYCQSFPPFSMSNAKNMRAAPPTKQRLPAFLIISKVVKGMAKSAEEILLRMEPYYRARSVQVIALCHQQPHIHTQPFSDIQLRKVECP